MHFSPGQNFECSHCTKCCRGWRISVDEATRAQLEATPHSVHLQTIQGRSYIRRGADDACAFLTDENLCQLHLQSGPEAKPWGCQVFPFRLVRTPDGVYVGISLYCSSAQQNRGRPLSEYADELERLAQHLPVVGERPISVHGQQALSWTQYKELDNLLSQALLQDDLEMALGRALWSLCQWLRQPRSLTGLWQMSQAALEPPQEPFVLMEEHFQARLMAHFEAEASEREAFARQFQAGKALVYRRFAEIRCARSALSSRADEAMVRRYLEALVFRKFLLTRRSLLQNMALLMMVPRFFRGWSQLSRLARGGEVVEEQDTFRALDECERRLITHPNNLDEISGEMAASFLDQVPRWP